MSMIMINRSGGRTLSRFLRSYHNDGKVVQHTKVIMVTSIQLTINATKSSIRFATQFPAIISARSRRKTCPSLRVSSPPIVF